MNKIFPLATPDRAGWTSPHDMKSILNGVFSEGWDLRLPFGKVVSSVGSNPIEFSKSEERCFEFLSEEGAVLFSPSLLMFEKVNTRSGDPLLFLWMDLSPLPVTPNLVESYAWPVVERLTEIAPGIYMQPHFWKQGKLPNGDPLPESARFLFRCLDGGILVAPKGSSIFDLNAEEFLNGGEQLRLTVERKFST